MTRIIAIAILAIGRLAVAQPLQYETRHVTRTVPGCGDAKGGCAHVELNYIEVASGPPLARGRINSAILAYLVDGGKLTPQEYVNDSIKDFLTVSPGHQGYLLKNVTMLRATPPLFSVECSLESFELGGQPHPYFETRYLNFDAATGNPVTLSSFLKDGSMARLTAIAETHFRKERKLGATGDLEGFTFPHNRFELNETYGFGEDRLVFFFNRYEIAAYVMGATRIEIPYDEIRDLLRPGLGTAPMAPAGAGVPGAAASEQIRIKPLLDDLAGETDDPSLSPDV
ncbi:MAG TPA: RsiV family protein [Bryobacteraceae bacterium]|nr:RsiV family protein [Bryobacteraceae bacterium]